jgi:hypothetical protein
VLYAFSVLKLVIMMVINLPLELLMEDAVIVEIGKLGRKKVFAKTIQENLKSYKFRKM